MTHPCLFVCVCVCVCVWCKVRAMFLHCYTKLLFTHIIQMQPFRMRKGVRVLLSFWAIFGMYCQPYVPSWGSPYTIIRVSIYHHEGLHIPSWGSPNTIMRVSIYHHQGLHIPSWGPPNHHRTIMRVVKLRIDDLDRQFTASTVRHYFWRTVPPDCHCTALIALQYRDVFVFTSFTWLDRSLTNPSV
jgi:hypothetical protein